MAKLKLDRFVANEIKLIEEILEGKELPSYYSVRDVTKKLFKYYVEEQGQQIDEAIKNICHFLNGKSILYSRKEINSLAEWYDPKKSIPLRKDVPPMVFYESEVDIIRGLEKREHKRMLLGFMIIAKIQKLYSNMKEPSHIYYTINEVAKFCGMNNGGKIRAIRELGLCGYILAPFDKNYLVVNCLSDGNEKEVLTIYDFEPNMNTINDIFIKLVGKQEKKVIAIPLDDCEDCIVYDSINMALRELGINAKSDISICCKLNRLSRDGYMFFLVEEDDTEEFLNFVAYYYRNNIAPNYRRMKKSGELNGVKIIWCNPKIVRDIYNKFMEAIEEQ